MATATTRTAKSTLVVPRRSGKKNITERQLWTEEQKRKFTTAVVAKTGNKEAVEQFVNDYYPWVMRIVTGVLNKNPKLSSFRDIFVSAGVTGLLEGLKRFKPEKGFLPVSFLSHSIWREVQDEVERVRLVTISLSTLNYLRKGRKSEDWTIASYHAAFRVVSLDHPQCNDDEDTLPQVASRSTGSDTMCLYGECQELLSRLSPTEKIVISFRLGLDGNTPMTLKKLAKSLSLTKERVRQIEKQALIKLRRFARSQGVGSLFNLKISK